MSKQNGDLQSDEQPSGDESKTNPVKRSAERDTSETKAKKNKPSNQQQKQTQR